MKNIQDLLGKVDINAKNLELYQVAFTHSSSNADCKTKHHDYQRLEFLGDSVVGLVVAELAFEFHPKMTEGILTKLRSSLISTNSLANFARELSFHEYIKVGNSFVGNVKDNNHVLEDVFEAFVGALYLDQGFDIARLFIVSVFEKHIRTFNLSELTDYKSKLQEEMQAEHRESVSYELVEEKGPAHNRTFVVRVLFDGIELGIGEGSTKKAAEQMAAKVALGKKAK